MDEERETQRRTYQLCRVGFALLSVALVLASLSTVLQLLAVLAHLFLGMVGFRWLWQTALFRWIDAPIVFFSLVGTYLFWGRWNDRSWQRRAGLLVILSAFDAVAWFVEHGEALGLRVTDNRHEWLWANLGQAVGWAEFALVASLACDLMAHLGVEHAPEAGRATRSLAATGAIVFMLSFCDQTDLSRWPIQPKGAMRSLESLLLFLGSHMLWAITLIQVTTLSIAATRQTAHVLAEMDHEDHEGDLLGSPSDKHKNMLTTAFDDRDGGPYSV